LTVFSLPGIGTQSPGRRQLKDDDLFTAGHWNSKSWEEAVE